ncbi:MAG: molybdate ABC transporter substrate-binding protein [Eggerthellaceae bacterium]|jgi:molybdate transport system substrate-binding protein
MISNAAMQTEGRKGAARLLICVFSAVLACLALAGCSSTNGESADGSSGSADTASQQKTTVSVLCADQLAGPLSELEQLYASENDDVQFAQKSEGTGKALAKDLADNAEDAAAAAAADASEGTDASTAETADDADYSLVVGLSDSAESAAQKAGQIDGDTVSDLVGDTLVIAAGTDGKAASVTVNDLVAGKYPLLMAPADSALGTLQRQALRQLGAQTASGAYVGALAKKGAVKTAKSATSVFAKLSESTGRTVSIVRASDVYRYGGAKVVGEIPAHAYTAPVYSSALTAYANDAQLDAARKFLEWCTTDADAQRIWQKWGFKLAA